MPLLILRLSVAFLSTLSLRRATTLTGQNTTNPEYFYPRSPCGERRNVDAVVAQAARFLSTLSLRRATGDNHRAVLNLEYFYPRSPCGERLPWAACAPSNIDFYPRSPCGERLPARAKSRLIFYFYPRSPCGERPCFAFDCKPTSGFLSTLSLRRATH